MKKRILIIDDDLNLCQSFIDKLSEQYAIYTCFRFNYAERLIQLYQFDVIIIDINMNPSGLNFPITRYNDCLYSGLFFYKEKLKHVINECDTIIVFWSMYSELTFLDFFNQHVPPNVSFVNKMQYSPDGFLEYINSLYG